jgi:TRAP-type mannitol/chloroaromatic compound transport system permease small subunit
MNALLKLSRLIDSANTRLGRIIAWCVLIAILVSAINATVRKVFDLSSNSWLELQWVLFGLVFLLCSPWTLLSNEHIRIDIVNNLLPGWLRNTIDVIGHAFFLMPVAAVLAYTGWPFFKASLPAAGDFASALTRFLSSLGTLHLPTIWKAWTGIFAIGEQSLNAGGLPQWPAKAIVPVAFATLFVQGISELIKRIAIMAGYLEETPTGGGHHAAAEAEAQRLLEELADEARRRQAQQA